MPTSHTHTHTLPSRTTKQLNARALSLLILTCPVLRCPVACTEASRAGDGCALMVRISEGDSSAFSELMSVALDECVGISSCPTQLVYSCEMTDEQVAALAAMMG